MPRWDRMCGCAWRRGNWPRKSSQPQINANKRESTESFSRSGGNWLVEMTDAEFRDAFHGHKDVVHRFAYRMTGSASAAEDVVQDCFLILWRKPAAYDPRRGAMRAFLLGIA